MAGFPRGDHGNIWVFGASIISAKRLNWENSEKLLMVQKSCQPVEVGSLSHYLQGLYLPGGFSRRISEASTEALSRG